MSDVTQILRQIEDGDPSAAEHLLPLVYDELRKLACVRMSHEASDHTLQATALVHEAYVRLVDGQQAQGWDSRGHFFAAAAEAMRRILVDSARKKRAQKRGPDARKIGLLDGDMGSDDRVDELLAIHDALDRLADEDAPAAEVVKLRYFAGLTMEQTAAALGVSRRQAHYLWAFSKSWLHHELRPQ